ncbi:hypothetical protein R4Z09_06175 [Niallia oryzisoli]|uniref:Uncharacterized protein n=1 Tax=Niallia oryzisoli TaxID=1737571 RepID=A0ABZ2CJU3_9BACI
MGFRISFGKKKIINLTIKDHVIRYVDLKNTNPPMVQNLGESLIMRPLRQSLKNVCLIGKSRED